MADQMSGEIEIMRAQSQRGTHRDFVEYRGGCVHQQMRTARGAHDAPQIARIHGDDRNFAALAEKSAAAFGIAIAARYAVTLPLEELRQQRARRSGAQNEDAHRFATLP